ncbi:hypothetical protein [Streptomyces cucumeris]|uniref:hypothetical protein n=1 Tax=Streptomyces cucumeris TaxID=2962890 RepID=UPI003D73C9D9
MRALWAYGLVLSMVGLAGCTGTTEDTKGAAATATPSAVTLSISGGVSVLLSMEGKGPEVGKPCTPPPGARTRVGAEVRVRDDEGKTLGTQKLSMGDTYGSTLKTCELHFSFEVSGASEKYEMSIEGFPPMHYIREDIRRGLHFYETEQGTLIQP